MGGSVNPAGWGAAGFIRRWIPSTSRPHGGFRPTWMKPNESGWNGGWWWNQVKIERRIPKRSVPDDGGSSRRRHSADWRASAASAERLTSSRSTPVLDKPGWGRGRRLVVAAEAAEAAAVASGNSDTFAAAPVWNEPSSASSIWCVGSGTTSSPGLRSVPDFWTIPSAWWRWDIYPSAVG